MIKVVLVLKRHARGNKKQIKLIAQLHLNGHSFILQNAIEKNILCSFKKLLLVSYITFSLHAYLIACFSHRPK
jgi:hypothetical protein